MMFGDECGMHFLAFVLQLRTNSVKIPTRSLTGPGIEHWPAGWMATTLDQSDDHVCILIIAVAGDNIDTFHPAGPSSIVGRVNYLVDFSGVFLNCKVNVRTFSPYLFQDIIYPTVIIQTIFTFLRATTISDLTSSRVSVAEVWSGVNRQTRRLGPGERYS